MRRTYVLLVSSLLLPALIPEVNAGGNVAYSKRWIRGTPVHVVTVNLNSPNVKISPAIARNGIGTSEGFGSMLSRLQPTAAITGTFFCVKSLVPVGQIVVDSKPVNFGDVGTAVCFGADNSVEFKPAHRAAGADLSGYESIICAGPRLVRDGARCIAPSAEGFRDRSLYKQAHRSALGVTKHNKLLLVTVNRPIYLSRLARIMRGLGAVDAVNLDGGSSTALSYRDHVLSHPGRRMTNLIVVYDSPTEFAKIKPSLAPSPVVAATTSDSKS